MTKRLMMAVAAVLTLLQVPAWSQSWPTRSITLVVPFPAGSATDTIGRLIADRLSKRLGRSVVVDNRVGGASLLGTAAVARAEPDGYTLLFGTNSALVILPLTQRASMTFDPVRDLNPIGIVAALPNILIVSPKLPVSSVRELIQHAKANPGKLSFASSGSGTITHLIGELFKSRTGIDAIHVPYRAGVQAAPDLMEGRMDYLFDNILWSLPMIREGKLKGLGITKLTRSPLAPDMPTIAEAGVPGFEGFSWVAMLAPANTPSAVTDRLSSELSTIVADPHVVAELAKFGAEAASPSPDGMRKVILEDTARWGAIIRDANIKVQP
jgi:tripartite-type tricarboxylate transporter receptor subunit TctC